jgi:hypothetical protein
MTIPTRKSAVVAIKISQNSQFLIKTEPILFKLGLKDTEIEIECQGNYSGIRGRWRLQPPEAKNPNGAYIGVLPAAIAGEALHRLCARNNLQLLVFSSG